jgi:hypothetical protein
MMELELELDPEPAGNIAWKTTKRDERVIERSGSKG